eukprot:8807123-Lingulodinium_polyedra.AAC.1
MNVLKQQRALSAKYMLEDHKVEAIEDGAATSPPKSATLAICAGDSCPATPRGVPDPCAPAAPS